MKEKIPMGTVILRKSYKAAGVIEVGIAFKGKDVCVEGADV